MFKIILLSYLPCNAILGNVRGRRKVVLKLGSSRIIHLKIRTIILAAEGRE